MEIAKALSDMFELPYDTTLDIPKIVMLGKYQVYIQNYAALIEYNADNIKLKYKSGIIEISGRNFEIKAISGGDIVISGIIDGVKLI